FRLPQRHHEQSDNKQTPGREFLQQVRNIKKQRLRPMNPLMKTAGEFDQDNVLVKSLNETDTGDSPKTEQREGSNPRSPSAPCIRKIGTPSPAQLIQHQRRK